MKADSQPRKYETAIDARGVAFAAALRDPEYCPPQGMIETPRPERTISLLEALAALSPREQEILAQYYWEDRSHAEIARALGMTVSNVIKVRQRAIAKLRRRLDGNGGEQLDEARRSAKRIAWS